MNAEIGQQVRNCRKAAGISASQVAEHLGITPRQFGRHERGVTGMTAATLFSLATLLRVSVDRFFATVEKGAPIDEAFTAADPEVEALVASIPSRVHLPLLALLEHLGRTLRKGLPDD